MGKTAHGIVANYINFLVGIVTTLLLTPYLVHKLGPQGFGLWSLTFSVLGFFGLLDLGFNNTLVRYVGEAKGKGDIERRDALASTMLVVYLTLSLLALIGIGALSLVYEKWLRPPAGLEVQAYQIFWILAFRVVLLQFPLSLFRSLLIVYQDFVRMNIIQATISTGYALLCWALLAQGYGVVELAWLNLTCMILEYALYFGRVRGLLNPLRISPRLAQAKIFREVASFSAASFVTNLASFILLRTDPLIVQSCLSLDAVALYAVPLKISEYLLLLFKQFMDVLTPKVAELAGKGDHLEIKRILLTSSQLSLVPATAIAVPVILLAAPLLEAWVGPQMVGGARVLQVLALSTLLSLPQIVASGILSMSGHHRVTARAALLAAILNLTMSIVLALKVGLVGVALGTLITTALIDILIVVRESFTIHSIKMSEGFSHIVLPLILPVAVEIGVIEGLYRTWPSTRLLQLVVICACGFFLFLLTYWRLSLSQSERQEWQSRLKRKPR